MKCTDVFRHTVNQASRHHLSLSSFGTATSCKPQSGIREWWSLRHLLAWTKSYIWWCWRRKGLEETYTIAWKIYIHSAISSNWLQITEHTHQNSKNPLHENGERSRHILCPSACLTASFLHAQCLVRSPFKPTCAGPESYSWLPWPEPLASPRGNVLRAQSKLVFQGTRAVGCTLCPLAGFIIC